MTETPEGEAGYDAELDAADDDTTGLEGPEEADLDEESEAEVDDFEDPDEDAGGEG